MWSVMFSIISEDPTGCLGVSVVTDLLAEDTEKALMPWSQFNPLGAGCLRTWRWLRSGYTPSAYPRTRGERDRSSRSRAFWRERDVHFDKAPRRRCVNCCDDLRDVWLDERPIPFSRTCSNFIMSNSRLARSRVPASSRAVSSCRC